MSVQSKERLKSYFKKGAYPTESQFADLIDSMRHSGESLGTSDISGLEKQLNGKFSMQSGKALLQRLSILENTVENIETDDPEARRYKVQPFDRIVAAVGNENVVEQSASGVQGEDYEIVYVESLNAFLAYAAGGTFEPGTYYTGALPSGYQGGELVTVKGDIMAAKACNSSLYVCDGVVYVPFDGGLLRCDEGILRLIGAANGIARLDEDGKVVENQLSRPICLFDYFIISDNVPIIPMAGSGKSSTDEGCAVVYLSKQNKFVFNDPDSTSGYYGTWVDGYQYGEETATGVIPVKGKIYICNGSMYVWNGTKLSSESDDILNVLETIITGLEDTKYQLNTLKADVVKKSELEPEYYAETDTEIVDDYLDATIRFGMRLGGNEVPGVRFYVFPVSADPATEDYFYGSDSFYGAYPDCLGRDAIGVESGSVVVKSSYFPDTTDYYTTAEEANQITLVFVPVETVASLGLLNAEDTADETGNAGKPALLSATAEDAFWGETKGFPHVVIRNVKGLKADKQDKLVSSKDVTVENGNKLSVTEEAKRAVFNDMWDDAWKVGNNVYGKYDPENAPDTEHPYMGNEIWMTYEEAIRVYNAWTYGKNGVNFSYRLSRDLNIRTAIPFISTSGGGESVSLYGITTHNYSIETIRVLISESRRISSLGSAFNVSHISHVLGQLKLSSDCNVTDAFRFADNLVTIQLFGLTKSLHMDWASKISLESLAYMVANAANTTAITIAVHANVYAKLTGDTTNAAAAALSEEELTAWAAVLDAAVAKNIAFATA